MTPKPDDLEPCACGARAHVHTFNTYVNVHCEKTACPFSVMADTAGRAIRMWNAAMRALKGSGMTRETADSILDLMR